MRPRKTILLVDSYPVSLSVRKFTLETWGYKVLAAETAEEALLLAAHGSVLVAVVELGLAGVDGNELVRELRKLRPDVRTILLSDSVRSGEREHGADAFLGGGYSPADLREQVRIMVQRKRGPKPVQHDTLRIALGAQARNTPPAELDSAPQSLARYT